MEKGCFKDKVCLVTGAGSGFGYAFSERMLADGATVYLSSLLARELEAKKKLLSSFEGRAHFCALDVRKEEEVASWISQALENEGRIDYLVNSAGIHASGFTLKLSLDTWRDVIDTNLFGVVNTMVHTAPIMIGQRSGHIINMSSISGLIPIPYETAYCASKHAVTAVGECLRYELARHNVKVTTICPTIVKTEMFEKAKFIPADDAITLEHAMDWIFEHLNETGGIMTVAEDAENFFDIYRRNESLADEIITQMESDRHKYALVRDGEQK